MSVDDVRAALAPHQLDGAVSEFAESSATVQLAAERLGTEPQHIAKTIGFYDPENPDGSILIVVAGDAKVNSGKFKRTFGAKPRMIAADDVERLTGHPVGGVCPFATPGAARVYLDESLKRFDTVFPAAGSVNSAVEVPVARLLEASDALDWVDVSTVPAE